MTNEEHDNGFNEFDNLIDDDAAFQDEAFTHDMPMQKKSSAIFYVILLLILAMGGGAAWFLFLRAPETIQAPSYDAPTIPADQQTSLPPGVTAPEQGAEQQTAENTDPVPVETIPAVPELVPPAEMSSVTGTSAEALPPPEKKEVETEIPASLAQEDRSVIEANLPTPLTGNPDDRVAPVSVLDTEEDVTPSTPDAAPQAIAALPSTDTAPVEVVTPDVVAPVAAPAVSSETSAQADQRISQLEDQLRSLSADVEVAKAAATHSNTAPTTGGTTIDTSALERQISDLSDKVSQLTQHVETLDQRTTTFARELQNQGSSSTSVQAITPQEAPKAVEKTKAAVKKPVRAPAYSPSADPANAGTVYTTSPTTQATAKVTAPATTNVGGWELRSAQPDAAWLGRKGSAEMMRYGVGQNIPGLGTVQSVRQESGRWVVQTSGGTIRQ